MPILQRFNFGDTTAPFGKNVLIASQAMRNDSQLVHKCNHVHEAAIPMVTLNVFAIMRPLSPGDFECVSHRERQKKPSRPF